MGRGGDERGGEGPWRGGRQNGFFPPDKSRSRPLLTHVTSFLQDVCGEGKRRGEASLAALHCVLRALGFPQTRDPFYPNRSLEPGGKILLCYLQS